jgi:hypothetical protein
MGRAVVDHLALLDSSASFKPTDGDTSMALTMNLNGAMKWRPAIALFGGRIWPAFFTPAISKL